MRSCGTSSEGPKDGSRWSSDETETPCAPGRNPRLLFLDHGPTIQPGRRLQHGDLHVAQLRHCGTAEVHAAGRHGEVRTVPVIRRLGAMRDRRDRRDGRVLRLIKVFRSANGEEEWFGRQL